MSIEYITISAGKTTESGNKRMLALINFVQEEMARQGINQIELSRRSGVPNTTLSRHLNNEVDEWRPSIILKIATGLEVSFWRLMIIAGYPVDRPGSPEAQDRRLSELSDAFPWLVPFAEDLVELAPEDRETVLLMLETIHRRRGTQSSE